jgi:L-alanine-DL-glutamate epimerase-like enolase superfamily enzyme
MKMDNRRIISIEWACLEGRRPRPAGSNARLGEHGSLVRVPILRVTTEDGYQGFGACYTTAEQASILLGARLNDVFAGGQGVLDPWRHFDYPLWDLVGQRAGLPVYAVVAAMAGVPVQTPYRVPCYDTSLYFDDLHLATQREAAQLLAQEAREGYRRGHRAFKIKVGRGARHLPLEEGTQRDIAIVHAVRQALGPHLPIMLDANNGYNLNLTKRVLSETAECSVFWIEEAFHEDPVLYADLRAWLKEQNLPVLISDGEGQADPHLLDWAREGLVDVIQYDILDHGFTQWLLTGRQLDAWGVRSAPHHYGRHYGNYAAAHLAGAIRNFTYIEWDEATTPGLDASGYALSQGWVSVPDAPGFGLSLDEVIFHRFVTETGFALSL